ncbi:MAG: S8 family serine peptidase [Desulfobulbaceae bacterium]|nr:S8 family serine peptidase [Desulfobulbaceae bacterium]
MRKIKAAALAAMIVMAVGVIFAGTAIAQQEFFEKGFSTPVGPKYVPDEIIVKFNPGVSGDVVGKINQKHGTSILSTSRFAGFKRLRISKGKTVEQMVEIYKRNPNVEYAEPNCIAHAFLVPNDEYYSVQWHLDNADYGGIGMEEAWDLSAGTAVIVAVIDTGVAYEDYEEAGVPIGASGKYRYITYAQAPDLADTSFVDGYDFVNDDIHPNDDNGHGTHVTGTIAQSTNNGLGVAGVAFDCSIMPVKVLDSAGSGTYADIADGIYFAADNGAQVINMSLGGPVSLITLENALAYAYDAGVTIVCASGNDGSADTVSYPAAYDAYCIAVGATRYDEEVSYYSNGGPSLDLTAPGGDINVDQNGDNYGDGVLQQTHDGSDYTNFGYWFYQGTSMAAPHVAGVAALVIANGVVGPDAVREALQNSAEDKGDEGWDPAYGWGIVDAAKALGYSPVSNTPPVADAGGTYTGTEDVAITFDGSASYDDDGDTLTYAWDFGDDLTGAGVNPSHAYTAAGIYDVTLVVNDGKEDSFSSATIAEITAVNDPPVADNAMHISSIDMAIKTAGINTSASAAVNIVDAAGDSVEGAAVSGYWEGLTSDVDYGVTINGQVVFESDKVKRAAGGTTFTFTVDNVELGGWTYDPTDNDETSASITVP